jgi:hypothetical protein
LLPQCFRDSPHSKSGSRTIQAIPMVWSSCPLNTSTFFGMFSRTDTVNPRARFCISYRDLQ